MSSGKSILEALKSYKIEVNPTLKNMIKDAEKLTVVVLKSGETYVFKYSTSPPPRYNKMKSLKLITGEKIDGNTLEKVQKIINNKNFVKTVNGKLFF